MESTGRPFERIFVIMFENQYRSYVMENPYFKELSTKGINMTNYFGVMHPSQTNYISSVSGELCNVTDDDKPTPLLSQNTIVDLVEGSKEPLSWKAYMDSYSPYTQMLSVNPNAPEDNFPYVIKHNPFSSYDNIVNNKERWAKVQGNAEFWRDIIQGTLPNYAWFTPDMWNDGHYIHGTVNDAPAQRAPILVDQAAKFLQEFFATLKFPGPDSLFPDGTLVVVTFDEADFEATYDPPEDTKYYYDGPNQIYTVLLGDMIKPGKQAEGYNHYSLLRTIEKNFNIGDLGKNDKGANWFQFLWDEQFTWKKPLTTTIADGELAVAECQNHLYAFTKGADNNISVQQDMGTDWSPPSPIGIGSNGLYDVCNTGSNILIISQGTNEIVASQYDPATAKCGEATTIATGTMSALSTAMINDGQTAMVVWADSEGALYSLTYTSNGWQTTPTAIGFNTTGEITLGVIGPSVYLVYQTEDNLMNVVSYNTADFNIVTLEKTPYSGPADNTTKDAWSPSVYPVAHFSHAANPGSKKDQEPEPVTQPYQGKGPMAIASLNGVMHLCHQGPDSAGLLDVTFSIPGIMTPKNPISYNPDAANTNSGYGTLAQAGWSEQMKLTELQDITTIAMTPFRNEIVLFYQAVNGKVMMSIGAYSK